VVNEVSPVAYNRLQRTIKLNDVEEYIETRCTIVGEAKRTASGQKTGDSLHPSEFPECDIIEMDEQGSEIDILKEIEANPRIMIVETHRYLGAKSEEVKRYIHDLGYQVL
jgi:tRNA G37 N-methylase Trm5